MPGVRFGTYCRYDALARVLQGASPFSLYATGDRAKGEWVRHVPNGGLMKLTARRERAGVVVTEITL